MMHPLVELGVALAKGGDVEIELIDLGLCLFPDQMGQFHRVHAAHPRAIGVVLPVPAADAMQDGHRFGLSAVLCEHLAARRPAGVDQPLHLQGGVDVRVLPIAVLGHVAGVVRLEPCGQHDAPYLDLFQAFLHVVVNGPCFAGPHAAETLGADAAVQAARGLCYRLLLREGQHDLFKSPYPLLQGQVGRLDTG